MSTIDHHSWEELQNLFHMTADLPESEADLLLRAHCQDVELRDQIKAMLEAGRTEPLGSGQEDELDTEGGGSTAKPGRFGAYEIVRHLGSGGTGSVYLVTHRTGNAVQRRALKVFPGYDTESFFTRSFAREEFILASLDHPRIPKLLDAGVSENGEPFLVMEYAPGSPIDAFCNEQRLSVAERVQLMIKVCETVAYAHRSLVVHLDLKPTNILASAEDPEVRLLDFGTSKLLEAGRTVTMARMATPAYAAPEQLRNEPVTTSCDIYALGAILFELLTGRRAKGDGSMLVMMEHSLNAVQPNALEDAVTAEEAAVRGLTDVQLRRTLQGDLSTIVDKCLQPAAKDRYPSVDALGEDLQRYLDGRPILARPQTAIYKAGKFMRRHRTGVAGALAALLLVAGSLGYAMWRQHQALEAAHRAVQMQQFMTKLFRLAHSGATGKPAATVGDLLQVGEETLPSFISDPGDLRAAKMSIAEAMYDDEDTQRVLPLLRQLGDEAKRAGDVAIEAKSDILASDLLYITGNDPQQAKSLAARAVALSKDRRINPEERTQIIALDAQNKDGTGDRNPENMKALRAAIEESERAHVPEDVTASAMNILALGLQARNQYPEALRYFDRTQAIYEHTPYATCDLAATIRYKASVANQLGDNEGALAGFRRSYELEQKCAGPDDLGTLSAHAWMGFQLGKLGRYQEALNTVEPDLPRWQKAVGENSMHMRTPLMVLAPAYFHLGRYADSEETNRKEIRMLQGKVAKKSQNMAVPEHGLAEALAAQHRYAEALPWAKAAVEDFPATPSMSPSQQHIFELMNKTLADVQSHLPGGK